MGDCWLKDLADRCWLKLNWRNGSDDLYPLPEPWWWDGDGIVPRVDDERVWPFCANAREKIFSLTITNAVSSYLRGWCWFRSSSIVRYPSRQMTETRNRPVESPRSLLERNWPRQSRDLASMNLKEVRGLADLRYQHHGRWCIRRFHRELALVGQLDDLQYRMIALEEIEVHQLRAKFVSLAETYLWKVPLSIR